MASDSESDSDPLRRLFETSDVYETCSDDDSSDESDVPSENSDDDGDRIVLGKKNPVGKVLVSLVQGIVYKEQVDVIVNSTSPKLDLSQGLASRAMLDIGGQRLQEECRTKYPNGIKPGQIAAIAGSDRLKCNFIYNVCVQKAKESTAKMNMQTTVSNCLAEAGKAGLTSIALPALGTGFQGFEERAVAELIIGCIQSFLEHHPNTPLRDIRIVVFKGNQAAVKAFGSEFQKEMKIVPRQEREVLTQAVSGVQVTLSVGKFVNQKCDVIVISATRGLKMDKGTLSRAVSEKAGPLLQQECDQKYPKGIQHGEIAVLGAGNIPWVKWVYCVSLPRYDKPPKEGAPPKKVLETVMKKCLEQAKTDQVTSLAFAALGTGHLMFPGNVSAEVMIEVIHKVASSDPRPQFTVLIDISPESKDLESRIQQFQTVLKKYQTAPVEVGRLPVGRRPSPEQVRQKSPATPPRGTPQYCSWKYEQEARPPSSWTHFTDEETLKKWKSNQGNTSLWTKVKVDGDRRKEIEALVRNTWCADKVGHGRDAKGLDVLKFTKLRVVDVERVENLELLEDYFSYQQKLFHRAAAGNQYTKLENLVKTKSQAAFTEKHLGPLLQSELSYEINETYMFHGTKGDNLDGIVKHGIDSKLASGEAMLGRAVYLAESSTKADQYVDERGKRLPLGTTMKMILARITMGDIYVTDNPQKWRRAPCTVEDCNKRDTCSHEKRHDSVVCDGKWIFREFVVYERQQAYPEFIIHYVREK